MTTAVTIVGGDAVINNNLPHTGVIEIPTPRSDAEHKIVVPVSVPDPEKRAQFLIRPFTISASGGRIAIVSIEADHARDWSATPKGASSGEEYVLCDIVENPLFNGMVDTDRMEVVKTLNETGSYEFQEGLGKVILNDGETVSMQVHVDFYYP